MSKQNITSNIKTYLPKPYKKRRYYIKEELERHNTANDLWVCFFNDIYDLTEIIQKNRESAFVEPIIKVAGTDISHWFDKKTKEPRKHVNQKGEEVYYCPQGTFLDLDLKPDMMSIPWWKNQKYFIGKLTRKSQWVRIINTLSDTQDKLQIPREQTISEISDRYQQINFHAKSYTWKRKGVPLNMDVNLQENGIVDQSEQFELLDVPQQLRYIPAIHIHFNDDLTTK